MRIRVRHLDVLRTAAEDPTEASRLRLAEQVRLFVADEPGDPAGRREGGAEVYVAGLLLLDAKRDVDVTLLVRPHIQGVLRGQGLEEPQPLNGLEAVDYAVLPVGVSGQHE